MEDFKPRKKASHASLPFVTRPSSDERFISFASEHDGFETFIHKDVNGAISREAHRAAPNETIGLLAGRVLRDERGPYTLVLASEGARADEVEATPSHVRISSNGHAQARGRLELSAFGLDIIGWYHSHPQYPARFSSVDVTEQSTWPDPNHVGIVISGIDAREPIGVYRGPKAARLHVAYISDELPCKEVIVRQVASAQTDTNAFTPSTPERKEEAIKTPEIVTSASAVRAATPPSDGRLRLLHWTLSLGLLGSVLILVWFDRRIAKLEKRPAVAGWDAGSAIGAPHKTPPVLPPFIPPEQRVPGEEMPTDKSDPADIPVAKAHPLIPGPQAKPAGHTKPKKRSKLPSALGGGRPRRGEKQGTPAKPNSATQGDASGNKSNRQPGGAVNKSAKP